MKKNINLTIQNLSNTMIISNACECETNKQQSSQSIQQINQQIQQSSHKMPQSNIFSISLFLKVAEDYLPERNLNRNLQENSSNIICQSTSDSESFLQNNDQYTLKIQSSDSENMKLNVDELLEEEQEYHSTNSNIMKNILKSFQRFIENEKELHNQTQYCQLANVSYSYSQLCKSLKFSLKSQGKRWNLKAKNFIEKSNFKNLFSFYLNNIDSFWLENSKVSNKQEHLKSIRFLINQIKNTNQHNNQLKFYKKSKAIIKKLY